VVLRALQRKSGEEYCNRQKIVEACNQILEEFEHRIINLEQNMLKTCGEQDVRRIVQEEMENRINVRDEREITNLREVV
jgi:ribosomal protein L9